MAVSVRLSGMRSAQYGVGHIVIRCVCVNKRFLIELLSWKIATKRTAFVTMCKLEKNCLKKQD